MTVSVVRSVLDRNRAVEFAHGRVRCGPQLASSAISSTTGCCRTSPVCASSCTARWEPPAPATARRARSCSAWKAARPETVDPRLARARVDGDQRRPDGCSLPAPILSTSTCAADIVLSLRAMDVSQQWSCLPSTRRRRRCPEPRASTTPSAAGSSSTRTRPVGHPRRRRRPVSVRHRSRARRAGDAERLQHRRTDGPQRSRAWTANPDLRAGLLRIWSAMRDCVDAGLNASGTLPGASACPTPARLLAETLDPD